MRWRLVDQFCWSPSRVEGFFILLYRFLFSQWDIGRSPPRVGLSVLFCDSFRTLSVSLPFALGFISPWLFIWSFLKFLLKVLDL